MSIFVSKRILKSNNTSLDVLIPLYENDRKRLQKLKENQSIEITIKIPRDLKRLRQYWCLVEFFMFNLPEHRHDELLEAVTANNREYVSEWLKFTIGYVKVIRVNGIKKEYPRALNFYDKKNENEIEIGFYQPVKQFLARDLGYINSYDLIKASLEHKENK